MLRGVDLKYRIHKIKTFSQIMNGTWIYEINTEQSWYDIKGFLLNTYTEGKCTCATKHYRHNYVIIHITFYI